MDFSLHITLVKLLDIDLEFIKFNDNNLQENNDLIINQFKNSLAERNYLIDKNNRLKNIVSQEEIDIENLIETVLSEDEDENDNEEEDEYEEDEDEDDEDEDDEDEDDEDEDDEEIDEVLTDEDEKISIESVSTNDGD